MLPRAANLADTLRSGESGIIYCLSKKVLSHGLVVYKLSLQDAETVADSLRDWSKGTIKVCSVMSVPTDAVQTATYHAAVDDNAKERIHIDWREGKVK